MAKQAKGSNRLLRWLVIILFTAGAACFCYPFAATAINEVIMTSRRAEADREAAKNAAAKMHNALLRIARSPKPACDPAKTPLTVSKKSSRLMLKSI